MALTDLTDFAVQFRYDLLDYNTHDLDRAQTLNDVTEVVDFVDQLIADKR